MADLTTPKRTWLQRLTGRGRVIIPVVRLHGVIAAEQRQGRLNIATVAPLLQRPSSQITHFSFTRSLQGFHLDACKERGNQEAGSGPC